MIKKEEILVQIQEILKQQPIWHVWVVSYLITQSLFSFILHQGNYPHQYIEILCGGCSYFSGLMQGGPYYLSLQKEEYQGEESFVFRGNHDEFMLVCERISIGKNQCFPVIF